MASIRLRTISIGLLDNALNVGLATRGQLTTASTPTRARAARAGDAGRQRHPDQPVVAECTQAREPAYSATPHSTLQFNQQILRRNRLTECDVDLPDTRIALGAQHGLKRYQRIAFGGAGDGGIDWL